MNTRILHTLNKEPQHGRTQNCLEALQAGDTLLLLENGVNLIAHATSNRQLVQLEGIDLVLMSMDVTARGLQARMPARARLIDYDTFVALSLSHAKVIGW